MRRIYFTVVIIAALVVAYQTKSLKAAPEDVIWTSLVNTSASGNTLTKSSDLNTGGAVSSQSIASGDGYVEFTVLEFATNRGAGLSNGNPGVSLEEIDFAIRLNGDGSAEVWENNVYKGETTYESGNVFRVEVVGLSVLYKKGGVTFHETVKDPSDPIPYPLLVDAFLDSPNATIANAVISGGSGGPPSGLLFRSNWSTALGNGDAAVRDTSGAFPSPWDLYQVGGGVEVNPNMMVVVNTFAPAGLTNSLRIQQQGSTANGWCRVVRSNFTPSCTDYYVRFYIRNDDVGGTSQDHVVQPGMSADMYNDLTYMNKYSLQSGGWRPRLVIGGNATDGHGGGPSMPNWQLQSPTALAYGRWYRFEYHVQFVDCNHIRVYPRIYDDTNTLRFQAAHFVADPDYMPWMGFSDWNLANYYASVHGNFTDFQITPGNLVNIEFGNNGSSSATYTGLYWYYAGVEIRSNTWPGPVVP